MNKLNIIYEDKFIIVINKKPSTLTIQTNKKESHTLYNDVKTYLKKQNPHNKVFIVHRLDKDTSGLIIFAKSPQVKEFLQNNWHTFTRQYYAITENIPPKNKARLINYLAETKTLHTYCTNSAKGKQAITDYQIIKTKNNRALLNIQIITGRKNQIRVQLANINCPILGDKKYSPFKVPYHRLCLHAYKLTITHPITKKELEIYSIFKGGVA